MLGCCRNNDGQSGDHQMQLGDFVPRLSFQQFNRAMASVL
jgi:hypothetical protein